MEPDRKTLLFCPLDWGLGHASRDIYIIKKLIDTNAFKIIIGADKGPWYLLKAVFPDQKFVQFPSLTIHYSKHFPLWIKMFFNLPSILFNYWKEHRYLKKLIHKYSVDVVISDNRYGLWNRNVKTVFITHQLQLILPGGLHWLEKPVTKILTKQIKRFDECWIPDFPGEPNLAGRLSHPAKTEGLNLQYIGPVSRFLIHEPQNKARLSKQFDVVAILSGPEPQRSLLESILIKTLRKTDYSVLIIRGIPWKKQGQTIYHKIQLVSHLPDEIFRAYLKSAKYIICRSGYSSIMDLSVMDLPAILIPTPGQSEQEYLGLKMKNEKIFHVVSQKEPDIQSAMSEINNYKPHLPEIKEEWINAAIRALIAK